MNACRLLWEVRSGRGKNNQPDARVMNVSSPFLSETFISQPWKLFRGRGSSVIIHTISFLGFKDEVKAVQLPLGSSGSCFFLFWGGSSKFCFNRCPSRRVGSVFPAVQFAALANRQSRPPFCSISGWFAKKWWCLMVRMRLECFGCFFLHFGFEFAGHCR